MNIPIEIDESVFEFTGENYSKDIIYLAATLNVPIGSKALYSNVKGWKKFANIQETEFTGVETIKQNRLQPLTTPLAERNAIMSIVE